MKPIIGITPEIAENGNISLRYAYTHAIEAAGGIPLLLPCTEDEALLEELAAVCHGFVFSGGEDIDPKYYGEQTLPACGEIAPRRDAFELRLFAKVFPTGKPILGICRGLQLINVALGGTLWQDLPSQMPSPIPHKQTQGDFEHSHCVELLPDSILATVTGKTRIPVNSFHHQAVKTLGRDLAVIAQADDGIVEALHHTCHPFLLALQWHPERLSHKDADAAAIFRAFLSACG